ncbi:MAG: hypothetical protein JSS27_17150 [Planctomycetes bacterium]|nr:hypothetical protein [Planctomycetota bacterium]
MLFAAQTMRHACLIATWGLLGLAAPAAMAEDAKPAGDKPRVTFTEVQAVFREHCYTCHNQDQAKSDLALDSYASTMRGGAGGDVVFAGDLDNSRLWTLVSHKEAPKMPPEQDKLPEAKLNIIKQWILDGALENPNSKIKTAKKKNLELNATASMQKPAGPPPMPEQVFRQPLVVSARPGAITALAASPWAPLAAAAGQKQILLFNTDKAQMIGVLPFAEGVPQVLRFSRNGSLLLAAGGRNGQSGRVALYDVKKAERVTEIGDEVDTVLAADISPDQTLVALGGPRRIVRVYDVSDGEMEYDLRKHTDWIYAAEFSPNGKYLATSDRSGGILVWEAKTGREYQNLAGHTNGVGSLSWRADGKILASASEDGTIKLWNVDEGKPIKSWGAHSGGATAVQYTRDGKLVSGGRDKRVQFWDENGKSLRAFPAMADQVLEVAAAYDNHRVLAGDWTGEICILETTDGKLLASFQQNPPTLDVLVQRETDQIATLTAELKKAEDAVAGAKKPVDDHAAALKKAEADAASNAAASKKLETELPQLEAKMKQAVAQIEALRKQQNEVEPQLRSAQNDAKKSQVALADQAKKLEQAQKDSKPTEELAKAKDAADKASKAAESKLADSQKRLDGVRKQIADITEARSAMQKDRESKVAVVKPTKDQGVALKATLEKLNKSKPEVAKALAEREVALAGLRERLAAAKDALARTQTERAAYDAVKKQQQASVAK